MQILLNGNPQEVPASCSLAELVGTLELGESRFAVEVNEEVIPRSELANRSLQSGDRIEIVQAIGGG